METDWREILNFSHRELKQADKEKLCESLSWMEADDIELNFSDLKTLFRLAQDILKYKSEQVNSFMGRMKTLQNRDKVKGKDNFTDSPVAMGSDNTLDIIAHQEEVIKANKDILEQLYTDIAELKERKSKYEEENIKDKESESSRGTLSELNAIAQLENEISKRNRHIRKLLGDVKILEEENTILRQKLSIFKVKLKEATLLIENLTEQLFIINNENSNLKESLGTVEKEKASLFVDMENLKKDMQTKTLKKDKTEEDIKSKIDEYKNLIQINKTEIECLLAENSKLKEELIQSSKPLTSPKKKTTKESLQIQELQQKLAEASEQMLQTADLIRSLKNENIQLKAAVQNLPENFGNLDKSNQSDDGKEKNLINKLKKKIKNLTITLHASQEMVADREKELTEIAAQLQLLRSNDGINALIVSVKNKKRHIKIKDEGIKSLVHEINNLNRNLTELQLENETMREKLNIPINKKIATNEVSKKLIDLENMNMDLSKKIQMCENKLVTVEMENHIKKQKITELSKILSKLDPNIIKTLVDEDNKILPEHSEDSLKLSNDNENGTKDDKNSLVPPAFDIKAILEENEGLRNGLTEILNFLKDNSNTSSGVLTVECHSLEAVLNSMEARKAAGWFSPHMKTVMELKAALGGKDALLNALSESRKETFQVMNKLSQVEQKSQELEERLFEITKNAQTEKQEIKYIDSHTHEVLGEFGSWMSIDEHKDIDIIDKTQIDGLISKGNSLFENKFKQALRYFQHKFSNLFDKFTSLAISATDDHNQWSIQEENYKAEIENLKLQLDENDNDISVLSPGLLSTPSLDCMERKCSFLEEAYKRIRTLYENLKNDFSETKKENMLETSQYEKKIQTLIISMVNLTDKLRNSVPLELFSKQTKILNEYITKYRMVTEAKTINYIEYSDLQKRLEEDKVDIINQLQKSLKNKVDTSTQETSLMNANYSILQKQLNSICLELDRKNNEVKQLENKNLELQNLQAELINIMEQAEPKEEIEYLKKQSKTLIEEHSLIKDQYQTTKTQLDNVLLMLQQFERKKLDSDIEINMLRHQILDLQSSGDNKAIIARLSGEILLAQLQTSESYENIETLKIALNKEKQLRADTEEILMNRQKVFNIYSERYERKFLAMHKIIDILREQYQGCLPLISIEKFQNKLDEIKHRSLDYDEKINEIEDLRSSLMTKHSVYTQILDISKATCVQDEKMCPHLLQYMITEKTQKLELEYYKKKFVAVETSHKFLVERCDYLETALMLVNQSFKITNHHNKKEDTISNEENDKNIELESIETEDDSISRRSQTFTLSEPKADAKTKTDNVKNNRTKFESNLQTVSKNDKLSHSYCQTDTIVQEMENKSQQTDYDQNDTHNNEGLKNLLCENAKLDKLINDMNTATQQQKHEILNLNKEKNELLKSIQSFTNTNREKDENNRILKQTIDNLKKEIQHLKSNQINQINEIKDAVNSENQTLLTKLEKIENDKNKMVAEYKDLLNKEREEYKSSVNELQVKLTNMRLKQDQRETNANNTVDAVLQETANKYTQKICDLENKCFKLQSELETYKSDLSSQQSELERWKNLASERLTKMEQLSAQLKERHNHEMESYKAENQHWLSQLNETQREHMELRNRLTEQKALHLKQMADKDSQIEQLRSVVNSLKTQILNMQTMLAVNDPSFDLSAIVEVEEASDASQQGSVDRLELKFESTIDLNEIQDDFARVPSSSTAIWQEPLIERLRREKQLVGKQNAILRRQIKVLAARERRSRLDAQNLKNQVFRISTSGSKVPSVESAALQNKIATLQAQLSSARRDAHSTVALWDKWKRAQQSSERWQTRYEERCQEVKKLDASLQLARSALARLEKEKRVLLSRLGEVKHEKQLAIEKHDEEVSEKALCTEGFSSSGHAPAPVSARALYDRVEAQQRRIVALELAEKGNEVLVSEYERCLAQNTSLRGQVLKLESALLEAQIRSPLHNDKDSQPELEYWKNYCDMLKQENVQLTLKINSLDSVPTSANQQRVSDLEQTVLTLKGLVSKLQAELKCSSGVARREPRPASAGARPAADKTRNQVESYRTEISNLKRSILEKDALLERSKEMLKLAADREEDLLRENTMLRRKLDQLTESKGSFFSA